MVSPSVAPPFTAARAARIVASYDSAAYEKSVSPLLISRSRAWNSSLGNAPGRVPWAPSSRPAWNSSPNCVQVAVDEVDLRHVVPLSGAAPETISGVCVVNAMIAIASGLVASAPLTMVLKFVSFGSNSWPSVP